MWRVRGHDPEAAPLSRPGAPQHPLPRRRRRRRRGQLPGAGRRRWTACRSSTPSRPTRRPRSWAGWLRSGCSFDVASPAEVAMALAAGADPSRISYGNTIKKEADIAARLRAGRPPVRLRQRGRAGQDRPRRAGRRVFCRILTTRRGCRLAAVAQVRLHARHGARAADPRRRHGCRALGRVVPCRLAAEEPGRLGGSTGRGGRACSATSRPSASSSAWSISAAASRRPTAPPCRTPRPTAPRSWPRCAVSSATASRS